MDEPKSIRLIEDRWTVIRHAVEAIAIVAAGVWAFYTFIYQERIKPALEPPSLELNLDFDRGTIVRGVRVANLNVIVRNTGHNDVQFVGETFSVFGSRFLAPAKRPQTTAPDAVEHVVDYSVPLGRADLVWTFGEVRSPVKGASASNHFVVLQGQEERFAFPIAVTEGRYDRLKGVVQIGYTKAATPRGSLETTLHRDRDGAYRLEMPGVERNGNIDTSLAQRTINVTLSAP